MKYFILFLLLSTQISFASEAVGSYTNGSLIDGECLPESGEGYMQLFREVEHIWGTSEMIAMLKSTAADMSRRYPGLDRLQIEDISAKNGGDIDPHGSHENGLDVDIGYFKNNHKEHDPRATGQYYAPSMVESGHVSSNFDVERNWELMKSLHRHGRVQRIFMDQTLKNQLCQYARSQGDYSKNIEVLRSIRHVENHQDHMHVRLRCSPKDKRCVPQGELPAGSGCP